MFWICILYFSFALIEIAIFGQCTCLIWISCLNFALIAMWLVVRGAILGSFWGCVSHLNFALIEICFKLIILLLIEICSKLIILLLIEM